MFQIFARTHRKVAAVDGWMDRWYRPSYCTCTIARHIGGIVEVNLPHSFVDKIDVVAPSLGFVEFPVQTGLFFPMPVTLVRRLIVEMEH